MSKSKFIRLITFDFPLKKEVFWSLFFKGLTLIINFITVPFALSYLESSRYGIWLTVTALLSFFGLLDFGFSAGMRVKLAEAKAQNDRKAIQKLLTNFYIFNFFIALFLSLILFGCYYFLDLASFFNIPPQLRREFHTFFFLNSIFFILDFILKFIHPLLQIHSKTSISLAIQLIISILNLILVWLLLIGRQHSLIFYSLSLGFINLSILILACIYFFKHDFRAYLPNFRTFAWREIRDFYSISLTYFIMQVSTSVVLLADNILISVLFNPESVSPYHLAFKYFGLVQIFFMTIHVALLGTYAEKYFQNDLIWLRKMTHKLLIIWLLCVLLIALMLIFSNYFFLWWLGKSIQIPFVLSAWIALFFGLNMFKSVFGLVLGSIGKIRLSTWHSIFNIIFNIPLSIFLAKYLSWGLNGIIIATIICLLPDALLKMIQYQKIMSGKAQGIWNQ